MILRWRRSNPGGATDAAQDCPTANPEQLPSAAALGESKKLSINGMTTIEEGALSEMIEGNLGWIWSNGGDLRLDFALVSSSKPI
ncbi:MAG: hypothetical protein IJG53_06170 [Eggerthellaceae bacterium]|nr:hypothetical protein [Eggerthellaceae bacterium]